jgi:hypothetical protein
MLNIEGRVVVTVANGGNSRDASTVDMTVHVSTYRDLQLFLERALKAAKALRENE